MKLKEKEFEEILEQLKALVNQLGATLRIENGDFKGGYCLMREKKIIVINKLTNSQRRAIILSTALKELGIDNIYVQPKLREIIDNLVEEP
ncbi:MAG: hypothetical protein AB9882_04355 [Ignavibacteriaceae bacterium]